MNFKKSIIILILLLLNQNLHSAELKKRNKEHEQIIKFDERKQIEQKNYNEKADREEKKIEQCEYCKMLLINGCVCRKEARKNCCFIMCYCCLIVGILKIKHWFEYCSFDIPPGKGL